MKSKQQKQKRVEYPIGSVSSGTMRPEDLIPAFYSELESQAKRSKYVAYKNRREHLKLLKEIQKRFKKGTCTEETDDSELSDLFDALNEYAGPYFYFGAHPGDGADYGYWLSEDWDEQFVDIAGLPTSEVRDVDTDMSIKVSDLSEVPVKFRGEVAVVNDHGNVTLYVKSARKLNEIWSIV